MHSHKKIDIPVIEAFVQKFAEMYIHQRSLTQLRDTLLPKLMSGEVRVKF